MDMDCGFSKGNRYFRYRTGGILVHEGKMLFVKSACGGYCYMIGGAVALWETSQECVVREVYEESGIRARPERLAVVCENFFRGRDGSIRGKDCHTLEFYYVLSADTVGDCRTENDEGEELVWVPVEEVKTLFVKPSFIAERIDEILSGDSVMHVIEERDR